MRPSWKPFKLDQLGSVSRGRSRHRPRNDPSLYGGVYPFFQTGDIKAAEFYLHKYLQTYNETGLAQSKIWQPGTLCITIAANIAETAVLSIPGCFPDSVVGFVANPERANTAFIKYYIDTIKMAMQNVSRGTTQDNLSVDKLLSFDFLVPDVLEQRRIASILSAYDDLIENNTRRIAIMEEMARRIYEEWFVQFRFPGHEEAVSPGELPEGWRRGPISELYAGLYDGPHATPKPSTEGPVFLGIGNLTESGHLDLSAVRHIAEEEFSKWTKRVTPQPGDIVFTYEATLNRYAIIPRGFHGCLGRRLALIRVDPRRSSSLFLYCSFFSSDWRTIIAQNTLSGATVDRIPLSKLPRFPVNIPPQEIILRFDAMVRPMFDLMHALSQKNANLRAQRDLLLPKLISGEIDVSSLPLPGAEDEAA